MDIKKVARAVCERKMRELYDIARWEQELREEAPTEQ